MTNPRLKLSHEGAAYLLAIRSLAFTFKMADEIDNRQIKLSTPKSKTANYSRNRKGKGSGLTNSR